MSDEKKPSVVPIDPRGARAHNALASAVEMYGGMLAEAENRERSLLQTIMNLNKQLDQAREEIARLKVSRAQNPETVPLAG